MNLKNFVQMEDVRAKMDDIFPMPELCDLPTVMKAPPITEHYTITGTAFDYLMRLWLKHEYPEGTVNNLVAFYAIDILGRESSFLKSSIVYGFDGLGFELLRQNKPEGEEILEIHQILKSLPNTESEFNALVKPRTSKGFGPNPFEEFQFMKNCLSIIEKVKKNIEIFENDGTITDEIVRSVISMAKMDEIYRSGRVIRDLDTFEAGDIADQKALFDAIPQDLFKGHKNVFLNPQFENCSQWGVSGDADLIIDGILIDIKTTIKPGITREMWRQIVGYAIMADLERKRNTNFEKIQKVGIYSARFGFLWTVPSSQIYENKNYNKFVRWMHIRTTKERAKIQAICEQKRTSARRLG